MVCENVERDTIIYEITDIRGFGTQVTGDRRQTSRVYNKFCIGSQPQYPFISFPVPRSEATDI